VEVEALGGASEYGPFAVKAAGRGRTLGHHRFSRRAHGPSAATAARLKKNRTLSGIDSTAHSGRPAAPSTLPEAIKIPIRESGLYRLTAAEIAAAFGTGVRDVELLIKHRRLSITREGTPVAYLPEDGNGALLFYGRSIDSVYTDENVYLLQPGSGLAMETLDGGSPLPASGGASFLDVVHVEENSYPITYLFDDPDEDYWLWDFFVVGIPGWDAKTFPFTVEGLATSGGEGSLTVKLVGGIFGDEALTFNTALSVNGQYVGDCSWGGDPHKTCTFPLPSWALGSGENVLEVAALSEGSSPYSLFYIDSFDVGYPRSYSAPGETLLLRGDGNSVISVDGFGSAAVTVLDLSFPDDPAVVANTTIDKAPDGSFRASFLPASPATSYLAVGAGAVRPVEQLIPLVSAGLRSTENGADYLIITPELLAGAVSPLAAYRASRGLAVKVASVESIADEFGHGITSPHALRSFLAYAYANWQRRPRYVVLAGEGTMDYKNVNGHGDSLVPVMMVPTAEGLSPSDNALADFNGDGVPEMAIGRLPVLSAQEVEDALDKIENYELSPGTWREEALWLADNAETGGDFPADSDAVAQLLPASIAAEKIYLTPATIDSDRAALMNGLTEGAAFLNFFGHGGLDRFAAEGLLTVDDVAALPPSIAPPVVTAMTCNSGRFSLSGIDSLAESLVLKANAGATAVWSPVGLSVNAEARLLDEEFYRAVFEDGTVVLGDAVRTALRRFRAGGGDPELPFIYNLLGDPALRLR
jgi:hypothetical protein